MNRFRARVRNSAIAAGCVVAVGLAGAQSSDPPRAAATAAPKTAGSTVLIPVGPPPDLFLLYTGDVIGYLDPCG